MPLYRRPGSLNWWLRLSVGGAKTRCSTGTSDRAQAEEFEHRERARLWRLRKLGDRSAVRWQDVTARWLKETTKRSRAQDERILAWLAPYLDEEPLSAIDRDLIEQLRGYAREDGMAPSSIDRYMALLRAVLRKCEADWRYLERAPRVPMYGRGAARRRMRFLTHEEFERLAAELPPHLALAARFAVLTGLRMRSMLRLTWDRVDLRARRAWIPAEQMKGGEDFGLPLSRAAARVLRQLKTLNPRGPHVFQWHGKPVDDCNGHAFKAAVRRAGVEPLRWHDLRHTFASWALQRGVTLYELMELGGWKSFAMVQRYAHLAPDHLAEAAEKVASRPRRGK